MPDYSLIPSLAVTQDQRGSAFNAGVGNANPSKIGSFLEGFTQSARDWTVTRGLQLEAQTKYDPAHIAAERLKEDLENDKLAEAVYQARVTSAYALDMAETKLENDLGVNKERAQDIRYKTKKSDLYEKYGEQDVQLDLQGKRLSNEATSVSTAGARMRNKVFEKYGEKEAELKAEESELELEKKRRENARDKTYGDLKAQLEVLNEADKIGEDTTRGRRGTGGAPTYGEENQFRSEQRLTRKEVDENQQSFQKAEREYRTLYDKEKDSLKKNNPPSFALRQAKQRRDQTKSLYESSVKALSDSIPTKEEEVVLSPEEQRRADLRKKRDAIVSQLGEIQLNEAEKQQTKISMEATEAVERSQTSRQALSIAGRYSREASEARNDRDPVTGRSNPRAAVGAISGIVAAKKMYPEDADTYSKLISNALGTTEDVKELLNTIDTTEKDPVKRAAQKKAVYGAIIESGKVEALQPLQQDLLQLGLGETEVADPEKAVEDLSTVISGKATAVDNRSIVNLREDPEVSPYIDAAQRVSQNGTIGFRIMPGVSNPRTDGVDTAQQAPQSSTLDFIAQNGKTESVTKIMTPKGSAIRSILETVASKNAEQAVQYDRTKQTTDTLTREQQARERAKEVPTTSPQTPEDAIQRKEEGAVLKAIADYEAKYKRPVPPLIEKRFRDLARQQADKLRRG